MRIVRRYKFGTFLIVSLVFLQSFLVYANQPLEGAENTSTSTQTSAPAPAGTSNSASSACSQFTDDKTKTDCTRCVGSKGLGPECEKSFSCESLFVNDKTIANNCNYERCLPRNGENYCTCKYIDRGIPLNTQLPFIGSCIQKRGADGEIDAVSTFGTLIGGISRFIVTLILLIGFFMVILGGVQWARGEADAGKKMIYRVIRGFALLGSMAAILRLINPNFFQ